MRIRRTGKICEDFYALGNWNTPVYLLDGDNPVLFDAGLSSLSLSYLKEIEKVLGTRSPSYLFITHAHFDHVGAASKLKKRWPEMLIAGSEITREILSRPGAINLIKDLNANAAELLKSLGVSTIFNGPFEPFNVDFAVHSGQVLELGGGCTVEIIHTPGHTRDFTTYWVPEKKILVAGEAVGTDDGTGYISTEFLVDFDMYYESLNVLASLDAKVLCQGHRFVFTGPDVKDHIERSLKQAGKYAAMVEAYLKEEDGDVERTVERLKAKEWDTRPWPKQPEQAYLLNTQARVKSILERMRRNGWNPVNR